MSKKIHRGGLVGPVLLIGFGIIFLLNNMGVLGWSVWDIVLRMWPLLLIAVGLDLLIGRRSVWGSLLTLVLILAVFIGGVLLTGVQIESASLADEVRQPLAGATEVEVHISPAVGIFQVVALDKGSDDLVHGYIRLGAGEKLIREFDPDRDPARFTLKSSGITWFPVAGLWGDEASWELGLNPDVSLKLYLSLGVGKSEIDLGGLTLTYLEVDSGIGQTIITLPSEGRFRAVIDSAIGETVVVIPQGMAARIHVDTALGSSHVPNGYVHEGDYYLSPGYETAENRVDLHVSNAIGSVRVTTANR